MPHSRFGVTSADSNLCLGSGAGEEIPCDEPNVTLAACHAKGIVDEITLVMTVKIGLQPLSSVIHPYPTQVEAIRNLWLAETASASVVFTSTPVIGITR